MTNARSWNQSRSDFNHGWLKNRLLIALCKAQNVLSGKVEDHTIWEHLSKLLGEWNERREDARRLISGFRVSASPARVVATATFAALDENLKSWLADLADRRWEATEHPTVRVERTFAAFDAFDQRAAGFQSILSRMKSGELQQEAARPHLADFLTSARALADAISDLGPSKV